MSLLPTPFLRPPATLDHPWTNKPLCNGTSVRHHILKWKKNCLDGSCFPGSDCRQQGWLSLNGFVSEIIRSLIQTRHQAEVALWCLPCLLCKQKKVRIDFQIEMYVDVETMWSTEGLHCTIVCKLTVRNRECTKPYIAKTMITHLQ